VIHALCRRSPAFRLGALVVLALSSAPAAAEAPESSGVDVVFLANEGVYLAGGDRAVLIDGCVREPYLEYGAVPDDVWTKLLKGEAPFARLDVVLVSHAHRDHFQVEAARELLLARADARWVVHREIATAMESGWARWYEVAARVTSVAPIDGSPTRHGGDGFEVELIRLPHGAARTVPENLAHVVHLGGRTLVHVGDAAASAADLARAGLADRRFDVGLLPYWYWLGDDWRAARAALAGRLGTIALHRPPAEAPASGAGAPHGFTRPLEKVAF
jgi:L-ascorbate metabolism protein UlaG (beta-lactamase superfamily)